MLAGRGVALWHGCCCALPGEGGGRSGGAHCILPNTPHCWGCLPAGANIKDFDLGPIELGKARRTGITVDASLASTDGATSDSEAAGSFAATNGAALAESDGSESLASSAALAASAAPAEPVVNRRCKRRKRVLAEVAA